MKTFTAIVMRIHTIQTKTMKRWGRWFWNLWRKSFAHISTLSTLMPHGSVASSSIFWRRNWVFLVFISSYIISKTTSIAEEIFKIKIRKILTCIAEEMLSLSLRISCRFFVPKIFRRVVWESSLKYDLDYISTFFVITTIKSSIINHQSWGSSLKDDLDWFQACFSSSQLINQHCWFNNHQSSIVREQSERWYQLILSTFLLVIFSSSIINHLLYHLQFTFPHCLHNNNHHHRHHL